MRISDWSSDVCSSDLPPAARQRMITSDISLRPIRASLASLVSPDPARSASPRKRRERDFVIRGLSLPATTASRCRSEEHTSELQSLMRISYVVFCLKKKKHKRVPCINSRAYNNNQTPQ